jgi:hypothetical protein
MDDLNGLDWYATSKPNLNKAPAGTGNYYPSLRPTPPPPQTRSSPLSSLGSTAPKPAAVVPPKSSTPDSFSNLVSFGSSKTQTLTLQEQQQKLLAEKGRKEEEKRKQFEAQFGSSQFWDGLGSRGHGPTATPPTISRGSSPAAQHLPSNFARPAPPPNNENGTSNEDNDLFAAFNANTEVDKSSHYPPPSTTSSSSNIAGLGKKEAPDLGKPQAWEQPPGSLAGADFGDDDDPFGLNQMKSQGTAAAPIPTPDDDDFLGDLAKPVEEVRRPTPVVKASVPEPQLQTISDDPFDKAVAEIVDMGFSAEQARQALTESGSGLDVQAAVGWILNDAHRQAKEKQQSRNPSQDNMSSSGDRRAGSRDASTRENIPAWMRDEGRDRSQSRRTDSRSPANGEVDISKAAAAVGSNILKTANSFWKTSQKKVQKAVAEFQHEADPNQPKWMREALEREQMETGKHQGTAPEVTHEALLLEGGGRPPSKKAKAPESKLHSGTSRDQSPNIRPSERQIPTARWQQTAPSEPRSRISKQAIEEQSAQAYVSPARRKKATPTAQAQPASEPDLFTSAPQPKQPPRPAPTQTTSRPLPRTTTAPSKPSTPIPVRPKAPPRDIPHLSSIALQSSTQHRLAGTDHFKRGDYAAAHQSYTSSLSSLPESHPITIVLLCNRALTSLKTGIPREAVSDADTALNLIGPSRGEEETIDLGPGEGGGKKDMKEFWGKALMRKAEALEQMEKWREGSEVWKTCVEAGVGGATAAQGRTRCERALAPKPPPSASRTSTPRPKLKPTSALQDLSASGDDSAAVERLRAANKAAEKADDEKFALTDKVDEKISRWRDGKRDNLRALIGSLDMVMWEGSAWKKVGMHELVTNGKVKINYMKAIGKCHPDKVRSLLTSGDAPGSVKLTTDVQLPQDASTETKLIAATVFSTLNESWDKFKEQNGI